MKRTLHILAIAALAGSVVQAEETTWPTADEPGLVQGQLAAVLYLNSSPIAIPGGVSVTAQANGRDYTWIGLPDAAVGDGDTYELTWTTPGGMVYQYRWPHETRTPQAVVWSQTFHVSVSPLEVAIGDTLPFVQLTVEGLASDPTGAVATFSMREPTQATVISNAPAILSDIEFNAENGTWNAIAEYQWSVGDTDDDGLYESWFTVTFVGGGVMSWPSTRDLSIRVVP